jgi:vacuolar-type H+-ATPase subunit E/Vma4
MASEKALSDEILQDARRKAERVVARAHREAKRLLDEAAQAAAAAEQKALDVARQRAERAARAILATVEQDARRDLLEAQEAELRKVFDEARARLADRASYDRSAVLARLAAEAIAAMAADQVVLELDPADREIATEAWLAEVRRRVGREVAVTVSANAAPMDGGGVVRSADGRLLYDNSFEARLRRLLPDLRREIAAAAYKKETP